MFVKRSRQNRTRGCGGTSTRGIGRTKDNPKSTRLVVDSDSDYDLDTVVGGMAHTGDPVRPRATRHRPLIVEFNSEEEDDGDGDAGAVGDGDAGAVGDGDGDEYEE